ncbi:solute carrier organic anion transporter family member 4A1-like [Saccoglossus kowalevskii]|uniref:Solute carrier organic anion transporter family member 4C1-like n=1 Tax=Saccoglossus kowalevskii TaxID=10224 RepID=A0ABM0MIC9_SACKO|nr:PREDICTED: solute carrier organic anion transporter family member 4C1-like [Saccoglossus kowalevskii]
METERSGATSIDFETGEAKTNTTTKDEENGVNGVVSKDRDDTVEDSLTCGWLNIRPSWLQRFNKAPWLASAISALMFVQGLTVNGFVYINLSTIETRFGLPSVATGLLVSTYDLTVVLLITFVSYFGATRNKARMLGIGAVIMGCGSLLWAVPHFTTGLYEYDTAYEDKATLCYPQANSSISTDCDDGWHSLSYYFIVFVFAQILHGIGASPIYTVGYAYCDENVSHRKSSWYTGILSAFSIFGPTTGFLLGAIFLSIWTDVMYADDTNTPEPVNLTHPCNDHCNCAGTETYSPVCGSNGLVYFDACYAGCLETDAEEKIYSNCSCIDTDPATEDARSDPCPTDCWQLPVFCVFFFLIMFLGFLLLTPNTVLTLRCVSDAQRAHALGISSIIYRVFGTIPGPLIVGVVVDSSCLIWQEVCDDTGSCWIYDNYMFGMKFFVLGFIAFAICTLLLGISIIVYKLPPPEDKRSPEKVDEDQDMATINPVQSMEQETKSATMNRQVSTVSLLGYTRHDQEIQDLKDNKS